MVVECMTPREKIIEVIRKELDDAMKYTYSQEKIDRIAPKRAEQTTDTIIEILREAMK